MVKCRVSAKHAGTIRDLEDRDDLSLMDIDYEVKELKRHFGNRAAIREFDAFFVKVLEGDYAEVYGFQGNIPELDKAIFKITMVCK